MTNKQVLFLLTLLAFLYGCGLTNMVNKYETVNYNVTPPVLQVHGGNINLSLDGVFPENYFAKKATVDITPVLIYKDQEKKFKKITIQGEEADGGEATIFYATGGKFSYQDKIPYEKNMMTSTLELRAIAKIKEDSATLGPRNIAKGTIASSERVIDNEELANNNHGYEHETILEESATIYFLVNQSNIRTTETSNSEIQRLKDFAKKGYKTHSIEITSFASPEGSINLNNNVSDNRMKRTVNYTKKLLRSLKVDGAKNNDIYIENSNGEDWEGFENLVRDSRMKDKRRINRIVNSVEDLELREQQIRDLSEIYDAIKDDILPQLRKSIITIRSYEPKKTDDEIKSLALSAPDSLSVNELLFAATLHDHETEINIYNKVIELHNDWRGYNNLACLKILADRDDALALLKKAEEINANAKDVMINKGIVYAREGKLALAQEMFNKGDASEYNQAILNIRKGEYERAAQFFKGQTTHNAVLSQILSGNTKNNCTEKIDECFYLNAIIAARSNNKQELLKFLKSTSERLRNEAKIDLEFVNFWQDQDFKGLFE